MSNPVRHVCILANPIAGSGYGERCGREVCRRLSAGGVQSELIVTQCPGQAVELAEGAARSGVDVVLVCGGDGTVNEAVQGLAGSRSVLAVMPLGTANVLAHEFDLPRTPRGVVKLVLGGRRRRLDLGRCGDRHFICMASVGFDAFVAKQLAERRTGTISYFSYVKPVWDALRQYDFEPLSVRVDGKSLEPPVYHLVVGNTRSYGGPFTMTPKARPDDGLLDMVAFGGSGRGWVAAYLVATTVLVHHRFDNVRYLRGRCIEVEAAHPVTMQLDGDFKGQTPVRFELADKAITLLTRR